MRSLSALRSAMLLVDGGLPLGAASWPRIVVRQFLVLHAVELLPPGGDVGDEIAARR